MDQYKERVAELRAEWLKPGHKPLAMERAADATEHLVGIVEAAQGQEAVAWMHPNGGVAPKHTQEPLCPAALPFAILDQEMKDLMRFHECLMDGEGYDVPKDRMKRLAEIGLLRRVTANFYEHTTFGLAVINGDFQQTGEITKQLDRLNAENAALNDYCAKVEKQRDTLLAALEELNSVSARGFLFDDPARVKARAAIASVKEQA